MWELSIVWAQPPFWRMDQISLSSKRTACNTMYYAYPINEIMRATNIVYALKNLQKLQPEAYVPSRMTGRSPPLMVNEVVSMRGRQGI